MTIKRHYLLVARALSLALLVQTGYAEILVSNLAEPERAATPIGNNPNPTPPPDMGPWYWAAQSFTTDDVTYTLDSIDAIVGEGSDAPPPEVFAALFEDNAGEIGTYIANFSNPDMSGTHSVRTFLPFDTITLQPLTTYWFVLGVYDPGTGTYFWYYSDTDNFEGAGVLSGFADSDTSGAVWTYNVVQPYLIQVNVTQAQDFDGDNVDDSIDVCCETPPGTLVDAEGRPVGDLDLDCDTDLEDAALFTQGFTGPLNDPGACP